MVTTGRTAEAGVLRALEVARIRLGDRPAARLALNATLVGVGCYCGNVFAASVRFPQIGAAILYPSYAVLAAVLILSPGRHWWAWLTLSVAAWREKRRIPRPPVPAARSARGPGRGC